jgi:hypothetical protein
MAETATTLTNINSSAPSARQQRKQQKKKAALLQRQPRLEQRGPPNGSAGQSTQGTFTVCPPLISNLVYQALHVYIICIGIHYSVTELMLVGKVQVAAGTCARWMPLWDPRLV